jgi:hypothetical protein
MRGAFGVAQRIHARGGASQPVIAAARASVLAKL